TREPGVRPQRRYPGFRSGTFESSSKVATVDVRMLTSGSTVRPPHPSTRRRGGQTAHYREKTSDKSRRRPQELTASYFSRKFPVTPKSLDCSVPSMTSVL